MPRTLGGTAEKRKPSSGRLPSPVICSQMTTPAPSSFVCTGRDRVRESSMLLLSMPAEDRAVGDQPVGRFGGEERMLGAVALGAPVPVPAGVDQHRLARDVEAF